MLRMVTGLDFHIHVTHGNWHSYLFPSLLPQQGNKGTQQGAIIRLKYQWVPKHSLQMRSSLHTKIPPCLHSITHAQRGKKHSIYLQCYNQQEVSDKQGDLSTMFTGA